MPGSRSRLRLDRLTGSRKHFGRLERMAMQLPVDRQRRSRSRDKHTRVHLRHTMYSSPCPNLYSVCQTRSSVAAAADVSLTLTGLLMCTVHWVQPDRQLTPRRVRKISLVMAPNEDVVKVNSSFGAKQIRYLSYIANANKCLHLYLYQVLLYYDRPVGQDVILPLCFLSYYLRQGGYVSSVFVCLFVC